MKKIRKGGAVRKNVERLSLASFVSGLFTQLRGMMRSLNVREVRMGLALACIALVFMVLAIVTSIQKPASEQSQTQEMLEEQEEVLYHPFTGAVLETAFNEDLYVFGVMVENAYDAWPLSGVEDAFLVVEAPVEGSIPRFMALFTSDMDIEEIGPVRSARPYYVDWAHGWNLVYAHVGGSPEALSLVKTLGVQDIDEFFNGATFWRSNRRYAPHNTYTTPDRLTRAAQSKEFDMLRDGFFKFINPAQESGNVRNIALSWLAQPSVYDVSWTFEQGAYVRTQGNSVAKSADGDLYTVQNVIFMETDIRSIDEVDRKRMRTSGEGDAMLFQNGNSTEIRWKKESTQSPLRFYDIWGNEVSMVAGKAWITVTDDLARVTVE